MLDQRRWKFGEIELVTAQFALRASELSQIRRIESVHQFITLVKQWLGVPEYRGQLIAIERCVTLSRSAPLLGRALGRENDSAIVAALQSAFEALQLHALRMEGRMSPRLLTANGRSWKFENAQIVERESAVQVRDMAQFFQSRDASNFSREVGMWLKKPISRQTVLELHKTIFGDSSRGHQPRTGTISDEKIVEDLLTAWSKHELYLLTRRISGGNGDENEPEAAAVKPSAGQRAEAKTWIEVVLRYEDGKPFSGAKYRLRITDGSVREGALNTDGSVRVNGILPGMCQISFPELDGDGWRPL
jgi:hypothetical protein